MTFSRRGLMGFLGGLSFLAGAEKTSAPDLSQIKQVTLESGDFLFEDAWMSGSTKQALEDNLKVYTHNLLELNSKGLTSYLYAVDRLDSDLQANVSFSLVAKNRIQAERNRKRHMEHTMSFYKKEIESIKQKLSVLANPDGRKTIS